MQSVQNSLLQNTALPLTMKEFAKTHFANMVISAKVAKGIMQKITVKKNPTVPHTTLGGKLAGSGQQSKPTTHQTLPIGK